MVWSVSFSQSPGKITLVLKPLHYILCLGFFFLNPKVTQIVFISRTGLWLQTLWALFPFNTMGKTGKCSLLFFFTFYVVGFISTLPWNMNCILSIIWVSSIPRLGQALSFIFCPSYAESCQVKVSVSRFCSNAGQQQFVHPLTSQCFLSFEIFGILFNILLVVVGESIQLSNLHIAEIEISSLSFYITFIA